MDYEEGTEFESDPRPPRRAEERALAKRRAEAGWKLALATDSELAWFRPPASRPAGRPEFETVQERRERRARDGRPARGTARPWRPGGGPWAVAFDLLLMAACFGALALAVRWLSGVFPGPLP